MRYEEEGEGRQDAETEIVKSMDIGHRQDDGWANYLNTGLLELEDGPPPPLRPPRTPPTAQLGFSRDIEFGMDVQVGDTSRLIRAIF